jgi:hypothetical protein
MLVKGVVATLEPALIAFRKNMSPSSKNLEDNFRQQTYRFRLKINFFLFILVVK